MTTATETPNLPAAVDPRNPRNYKWAVYNVYEPEELDHLDCFRRRVHALNWVKHRNAMAGEFSGNDWAVRETTAEERQRLADYWVDVSQQQPEVFMRYASLRSVK